MTKVRKRNKIIKKFTHRMFNELKTSPKENKTSVSKTIKTSIRNTNWMENLCLIFPVEKKPASSPAALSDTVSSDFNTVGTKNRIKERITIKPPKKININKFLTSFSLEKKRADTPKEIARSLVLKTTSLFLTYR